MSQRELAARVGITPRAMTSLESGVASPSEKTLAALVDVLKFPETFFKAPPPALLSAAGASFRSLARMSAARRDAALAAGALAMDLDAWIEERFSRPAPTVPDLRGIEPEDAAMTLRTRWRVPVDRPIPNMVHLLEAHGVRVYSLAEDSVEVDGFSVWNNDIPFVFLNTLKSGERGRMDAAHELGHLVLHRHGPPRGKVVEDEANRFASALLMPRSGLLSMVTRVPSVTDLLELRRWWRVSVAAIAHRSHAIGLLSDWHYRDVMIEISKRGWRTSEPDGCAREASQVLQKVFVALLDEGVQRRDVARALAVEPADLDALVFGLVPTAARGVVIEDPPPRPTVVPQLRLVKL